MKQKVKSLSSLKKRVKRSARGKFLHSPCGTSHNNGSKSTKQKRRLHSAKRVEKSLNKRMSELVPYK
jgi:ribosomal protein L35